MSQSGAFFSSIIPPAGAVTTLTGNSGGPVPPALGNINIIGAGFIDVVGNPALNTLTISSTGSSADQFDADSGMAIPVAGVLNIVGSANMHTAASGNTVEILLDDTVSIAGSFTAGTTAGFITAVTGDISADAGNFNLPNTLSSGLEGIITFGGNHYIQNFGGNFFLGNTAGNLTLTVGTAINNVVLGDSGLHDVTVGHNNTSIGFDGMLSVTSGSVNTGVGSSVLAGITSGSNNTALGAGSGSALLTNESNNILVGNPGVVADQNTIRIGVNGTGTLEQNQCFIAGIIGNTVANSELVTINSVTGQLGITNETLFAQSFIADTGTAQPFAGAIDVNGGSNINTSASGNQILINLDNTVSVSGSITAATGLTATAGGITATGTSNINITGSAITTLGTGGTGAVHIGNATGNTAVTGTFTATGTIATSGGDFSLPATTSTVGSITQAGNPLIHTFGGNSNFFAGTFAGNFTLTGNQNTGVGRTSLESTTTGSNNVAMGYLSGEHLTTGGSNTASGATSLSTATSGASNTAIGFQALTALATGSFNAAFGNQAGANYTGSETSNILILNTGTAAESNVIRIGTQGTGNGQQNTCFIAGIVGNTVATPQLVTVNTATGQLGVTSASGVTWQVVTGATPLVEGNGYFVNGSSKLQFTLPAAAAVGDTFEIAVLNTAVGGWQINQHASQFIIANGAGFTTATVTTTGTGGNVATTTSGGFLNVTLICAIANTAFVIEYSSLGTNLIFT